jgi:hypothetical protein
MIPTKASTLYGGCRMVDWPGGSPTLNTLVALLVSGLGSATHQLPDAPCCGMRRCDLANATA